MREYKTHNCDFFPGEDVGVYFSTDYFNEEQPSWYLLIQRNATIDDLEKYQYLEEEGDNLWTTALEVTHCPYCGESLYESTTRPRKNHGRSVLIDHASSWYASIK